MLILALNPGSTSLKFALFRDDEEIQRSVIRFDKAVLELPLADRAIHCEKLVSEFLREASIPVESLDCVVARGGYLKSMKIGAYQINQKLIDDLDTCIMPTPQTVGIRIAYHMMQPLGKPCFIYDAVSADEWMPIAKITGVKGLQKTVAQHTLNSRRVVLELADQLKRNISELNLIVAHLGGGFDVSFFRQGRIIESLGYNDLGFSPERCGALQFDDLLGLMKKMPFDEFRALNHGKGGLVSYFGTSDMREVEAMIAAGNQEAELVFSAMLYRVAQLIGCGAVALNGQVDGIILTGGGAYSDYICEQIQSRVEFIAKIYRFPGELELEALAKGAHRVMSGAETAEEYK